MEKSFSVIHFLDLLLTFSAERVSKSCFTSPVTLPSLFVTRRVIQTVIATVVDTVIIIGSILTYCNENNKFNSTTK